MQSSASRISRTLALVIAACACTLSGCLGGGIYSVRQEAYGVGAGKFPEKGQLSEEYADELFPLPAEADDCEGVSLSDALSAWCGPPEMFHEELIYGADPSVIVSPTPKYHPLPTRPVFQPMAYPPPAIENGVPATPLTPTTDGTQTAHWRGPLPRMPMWRSVDRRRVRVAHNPLDSVTFPPLPKEQQEPARLAPSEAEPRE